MVSADIESRYAILEFEESATEQIECAWEQRAVWSETLCDNYVAKSGIQDKSSSGPICE